MSPSAESPPERWKASAWAVVALAVLAGLTLLALATRQGPGVSPDSVAYASTAESVARNGHLRMFDGQPLTVFPPGLPLLLGLGDWIGAGVQRTALVINAVSLVGTVVCTYLLGLRASGSRLLAAAVSAWVAVGLATVTTVAMLWTEPLFGLLCAVSLVLLQRIAAGRDSWTAFAALAMTVSAAATVRFVAAALLPLVALVVVQSQWRRGAVRAFTVGTMVTALSGLGLVFVVVRNLLLGSDPFGPRASSSYSPLTSRASS